VDKLRFDEDDEYYENGGVLQTVLRKMAKSG
jgi:hypothetical protein